MTFQQPLPLDPQTKVTKPSGPPPWLRDRLTRNARPRRCRCGAPLLVGLDGDVAALTAKADPVAISCHGEAAALLTGRATYDAVPVGKNVQLSPRWVWHIRAPRRYVVLAEHRCGAPPLDRDPNPPRPPTTQKPLPAEPEF